MSTSDDQKIIDLCRNLSRGYKEKKKKKRKIDMSRLYTMCVSPKDIRRNPRVLIYFDIQIFRGKNNNMGLLLILASKTLSNSFSTWLSSVMPLYFPGLCTSPVLFHIGIIRPILHSFGILPSCIHTVSSLPVLTLDYQKYTPFFSRGDLQMTKILVSKMTESL